MLERLVFNTPDFIETTSWVTQLLEKGEGAVILEAVDGKCVFSFQDRAVSLESSSQDVSTVFSDEYDNDGSDSEYFRIEAAPLARFLKAIPRRTEKVVMTVELSDSGKVRAFAAQAGSVKFKLPTFSEHKAPAELKYDTLATIEARELFSAMAKAGNATNKEKGNSNNNRSMLDFHVANVDDIPTLRIFGTDAYVMNISEITIPNEIEDETRILIPSVYSALPEFAAAAKADETIEVIKTAGKKPSLGFVFPNGFIATFTSTSAKPIENASKIFERTVSMSTHFFDVDVKEFKSEISRVTTLNPEAERIYLSLSPNKVVFSDGADAVADMSIDVADKEGELDDDFNVYNIVLSKFVMQKMFSVISQKVRIYFSTQDSGTIYIVPAPEDKDDKDDKGVEVESSLRSEKTVVVLFRDR